MQATLKHVESEAEGSRDALSAKAERLQSSCEDAAAEAAQVGGGNCWGAGTARETNDALQAKTVQLSPITYLIQAWSSSLCSIMSCCSSCSGASASATMLCKVTDSGYIMGAAAVQGAPVSGGALAACR